MLVMMDITVPDGHCDGTHKRPTRQLVPEATGQQWTGQTPAYVGIGRPFDFSAPSDEQERVRRGRSGRLPAPATAAQPAGSDSHLDRFAMDRRGSSLPVSAPVCAGPRVRTSV